MIGALFTFLLYLLAVGVIWWGIQKLLPIIPLPEPIKTVVYVVLIVILCLAVIYALMGLVPVGVHTFRF